jgi:Rha family phage regulatory protein
MNVPTNHDHFNELVSESLKTSSKVIAEKFGKEHRNVTRDIRALIDTNPEWGALNFEQTPYTDRQNGQTYHMYEMTRDGYSMLVMGFTGKKAMEWKIKFLEAFNAMEERLRAGPAQAAPDFSDPAVLLGVMDHLRGQVNAAKTQLLEAKPKIDAYDQLMNTDGLYGLQNAARALGARPNMFIRWLKQTYLFYQGTALVARAAYRERGLFEIKSTIVDEKARLSTFVTPKGLDYLRQKLPNDLLIGGGK